MSNIVAEIRQEVQEIFQELTNAEAVSIAAVEKRVLAAVGSWGQRLSEAILSETASSTGGSPVSVPCPSCQGHSHRHRCRERNFTTEPVVFCVCRDGSINVNVEVFMCRGRYVKR